MRFLNIIAAAAMARVASASLGFAIYREIRSNPGGSNPPWNNADEIHDDYMPNSNTFFLYIQLIEGYDQSQIIKDFQEFARVHGANGVKVIPRVRYGKNNGDYTVEPKNWDTIMNDVRTWTKVFTDAQKDIEIPVIQAGFLGLWGEWHVSRNPPKSSMPVASASQHIEARKSRSRTNADIREATLPIATAIGSLPITRQRRRSSSQSFAKLVSRSPCATPWTTQPSATRTTSRSPCTTTA